MKLLESTLGIGITLTLAAASTAGVGGAIAAINKLPGAEYSCKVISITPRTSNAGELTVTTDGCSDTKGSKVFRVEASKLPADFAGTDFADAATNGKTYNLTLEGMTIPKLNMVPAITGVTEDTITDSLFNG